MTQNLQNLSLTATARTFWNNCEIPRPIQPSYHPHYHVLPNFRKYLPLFENFGHQVDNFPLLALSKLDLKLAIVEIGKRKIAKEFIKQELQLEPERPSSRDLALRECLPSHLHDHPLRAPTALQTHFSEEHQRRMVVDFFFALVLPNVDANPLRECWTSPAFVLIQSIFLDNFEDIWSTMMEDLYDQRENLDARCARWNAINDVLHKLSVVQFSNETIPWFVFELLDGEQRDKFLALRDTTHLIVPDSPFTYFFATIFCHWPWQDAAFDRCYARKEQLSASDVVVLRNVLMRKHGDESGVLMTNMLPSKVSFYVKLKNFLDAKNVPVPTKNLMESLYSGFY